MIGWSTASQDTGSDQESRLSVNDFEWIGGTDTGKIDHVCTDIDTPVDKCLNPHNNLVILGKAYGVDYWKEVSDVAELCTRQKITCHFAIDGSDLIMKETIKDVVQRIDRLGHIIIIEPSTADFATQMTASTLLRVVSTSAKHLQSTLGKKPVYVRLDRRGISSGQFSILVKNNFVPILVDEGSDFIYNTPSRFVIPYFTRRLETLPEDQSIVSLSQCTGIHPYN